MTEQLHSHSSLSCMGEGNGNPLQCSCLENPRDRGAWWAAVYGVAQSRTRLKRLSSSSSSSLCSVQWTTGAGLKVKVKVAELCLTLRPHGLYSPWNSPGQNSGVDSLSLLQGISPTQGLNPGLRMAPHSSSLAWKIPWTEEPGGLQSMGLLRVGHNWATSLSLFTFHSHIAGGFFTSWATREPTGAA